MSKKALVVDNDFFFVEFLSEILEERGYEVMKAYDGKEGISKLETGALDIMFVDLVMPKIDGRQFIKFTRKKFLDAPFPIVTVSGTLIEQMDEIDQIGADYYIAKGPMERMADHVNRFMNEIEKQPIPPPKGENLFEPEKVYPKQITVELMDTLDFHKAVIESIGMGVIVADRDARIINANSRALSVMDKTLEEILNYPITAICPKNKKASLINFLKGVIHGEESRKITFYAHIRSQEIRIVVTPLTLDSKTAGWIVVMEDTPNG